MNLRSMPLWYRGWLIFCGGSGFGLIMLATRLFGAGMSPDSVQYIAVARNFLAGNGLRNFFGNALIVQPPLYPLLLAGFSYVTGLDAGQIANVVSALLFAGIIVAAGILFFRSLPQFPALAAFGTAAVLCTIAIQRVVIMAWSEPLFILLIVILLILLPTYLQRDKIHILVWLAIVCALAWLTRYIGITLLMAVALFIAYRNRRDVKRMVIETGLFFGVATLPIGLWLTRNLLISGSTSGLRSPSPFSLWDNLYDVAKAMIRWLLPTELIRDQLLPSAMLFGLLLVAVGYLMYRWRVYAKLPVLLSALRMAPLWIARPITSPSALFVAIYMVFLLYLATTINIHAINNRYVSPVFVPMLLLGLLLLDGLAEAWQKNFNGQTIRRQIVVICGCWLLIYPIPNTVQSVVEWLQQGAGQYSSVAWHEADIIRHLQEDPVFDRTLPIYTNGGDALYWFTDLESNRLPNREDIVAGRRALALPDLDTTWPTTPSTLIWFNAIGRDYFYSVEELATISTIEVIADFEAGTIYTVRPHTPPR